MPEAIAGLELAEPMDWECRALDAGADPLDVLTRRQAEEELRAATEELQDALSDHTEALSWRIVGQAELFARAEPSSQAPCIVSACQRIEAAERRLVRARRQAWLVARKARSAGEAEAPLPGFESDAGVTLTGQQQAPAARRHPFRRFDGT